MNIIEQQDKLKSAPDDSLKREMQSPSGMFPQYLVMTEIQRREKMRKDYEGRQAADNKTPPRPSMAEEMAMTPSQPAQMSSGIGSLLEQPQQPQIPPRMQQEPVRMNVGMQVPYSANNPYASFLIQDDPLTEEDESESEYMKAMREYYEERNKLMPEKLEKERRFRGGLDLVKAGLAVGTSATGAELNKNLSGVIDSISKTNQDLRKAEDKMSKEQLEFSKAKAIEQGRRQDLAGKAGKFEQDEARLELDKEKALASAEYTRALADKTSPVGRIADDLLSGEYGDVKTLDIYVGGPGAIDDKGNERPVSPEKLFNLANQYQSSIGSAQIRTTGSKEEELQTGVNAVMADYNTINRIRKMTENQGMTYQEAFDIVKGETEADQRRILGLPPKDNKAKGGLISNSVDSFNDVIQNING